MHYSSLLTLTFVTFVGIAAARSTFADRRSTPDTGLARHVPKKLSRRGEPNTGDDDFPDTDPHPNQLDKVETAIKDANELTSYVKMFIATDNDIFPHYFDPNDRAEVQRIFESINNNDQGNDMLSNIHIQTDDPSGLCGGETLAYTDDVDTDAPFIVLCPNAFNKKAVTELKGKASKDDDASDYYASCIADGGDIDQNVSYLMNTLGMTLLHEYLHYDSMIASSFGSIIDNPSGSAGYGPYNTYDRLDRALARVNADSYAYYASQVLWTVICGHEFEAPRDGIDNVDPDCGNQACQN